MAERTATLRVTETQLDIMSQMCSQWLAVWRSTQASHGDDAILPERMQALQDLDVAVAVALLTEVR